MQREQLRTSQIEFAFILQGFCMTNIRKLSNLHSITQLMDESIIGTQENFQLKTFPRLTESRSFFQIALFHNFHHPTHFMASKIEEKFFYHMHLRALRLLKKKIANKLFLIIFQCSLTLKL